MSSSDFAAVVRRYRLAAGLTQEQLAERASLSLRTVGDIERGRSRRPYSQSAQLLGAAFGLSDSELDFFIRSARPRSPGLPDPRSLLQPTPPAQCEPVTAIPRQLPMNPPRLVGRSRVLGELSSLLDASGGRRAVVVAISGIAGTGKTALALRYAHREAHRYPDGQLYVDLHGSGGDVRPVSSGAALSTIVQSLHGTRPAKPASTDALAALYRTLTAGRRMMIVLDDVRDAAQVRPLLPSSPGGIAVITSRHRLTSLAAREGAHLVNLEVLNDREAQQMFTELLGHVRVGREPDAAMTIARCCFGLPLALSIAAARARARSHLPLIALANRLTDPERAWSVLDSGDPACDVRAAFASALEVLSSDARRMLQALAACGERHITAAIAADLVRPPVGRAAEVLDELIGANLLREDSSDNFTMNGLLQLYLRSSRPGDRTVPEHHPRDARDPRHWRARTPCA